MKFNIPQTTATAIDGFVIRKAEVQDTALVLNFIKQLAVDNGFGRVEWTVLNWNQPAIDVYKAIGAEPLDEWTIFRLSDKNLDEVGKLL